MTKEDKRLMPLGIWVVLGSISLAVVLASLLLYALSRPYSGSPLNSDVAREIGACRNRVITEAHLTSIDMKVEDQLSNHCIGESSNIYSLQDFGIRRAAFLEQYHQSQFILWLVVSITVSGIALASVQLAAAYNLSATFGGALDAGGSVDFSQGQMSVRSTVSGIIILALSFGFFLTYVVYVYPVREQKSADAHVTTPIATAKDQPPAQAPAIWGAPIGPFAPAFGAPPPGALSSGMPSTLVAGRPFGGNAMSFPTNSPQPIAKPTVAMAGEAVK